MCVCVCRDKTGLWLQQKICRDKHVFVCQTFVVTKMILLAAPANDRNTQGSRRDLRGGRWSWTLNFAQKRS